MSFDIQSRRPATLLAGERAALDAFLDDLRNLIAISIEGLSEEEARRRLVPSKTTLLGIVQHAAAVERFFFQRIVAGRRPDDIDGPSDASDPSWDLAPSTTIQAARAKFDQACAESRAITESLDLDQVTTHHPTRGPMTLRWVYLRMIEELSRHAGHADILREQIDATRPDTHSSR